MFAFHTLPRYLLTLPLWVRCSSIVLMVILFIILYIIFLPVENNPSILAIPVVQAAWMFKRNGVYFSVSSIVISIWVFVCFKYHTFLPSYTIILSFVAGTTALLVVGFLISAQRTSLDLSETTRIKLEHINAQQAHLNQLKDQFILNVNHELRTPLTAVYGYIELLLEHQDYIDKQKQREFLKNALYSCEELQLLVNNVLDTMQIQYEAQPVAIEVLSVAAIIQEVIIHTDPRKLQEHALLMDIPEQLFVHANAQYIRQVLRNLLSNALKYAPIHTPVAVKATIWKPDEQKPPMVCVCVQDSGPGIPPHEIPRMFGRFFRLERDILSKVRGTGLGLYVSKQLVEAMGGQIWVESTGIIGEGSRFHFTLPSANPQMLHPSWNRALPNYQEEM